MRVAYRLLPASAQKLAGLLVALMFVNGLVEVSGVAGIMPFISLASDPEAISKSPWLSQLYGWGQFTSSHQFLIFLGSSFIGLFTLVNSCRAVTAWLSLKLTFFISHCLAVRLLESYLGRSYLWLRNHNSNDLSKDVLHEIEALVRNLYLPLAEICTNGLAVTMIALTLLWLDPWVAVGTGATLGGLFSLIYHLNRQQLARNGSLREELNGLRFRAVHEGLYALREARLLSRRQHFLDRYRQLSQGYNHSLAVGEMIYEIPHYLTEIVAVAGLIGALMIFALRPQGQAMAWLMLYVMATWRLLPSLQNIYRNLARIRFFLPSLQRLALELEIPPNPSPSSPLDSWQGVGAEVRFEGVHFSYPGSSGPTLTDLSLSIAQGQRVALVGQTGSGKTTVADLVAGLLEPGQGKIWVDGQPLEGRQRQAWQAQVGYVPQEIFLSDQSVAANIALGLPPEQIDSNLLEQAARAAQIHEFIVQLPQGYSSPLGERGAALSGGQRQRIGIARALYHCPRLLIFDEATSALDELTQNKVLESLEQLSERLTILVIAHRLQAVRNCQHILLLDQGRLIAQGTYSELLEHSSAFQELVQGQSNSSGGVQ